MLSRTTNAILSATAADCNFSAPKSREMPKLPILPPVLPSLLIAAPGRSAPSGFRSLAKPLFVIGCTAEHDVVGHTVFGMCVNLVENVPHVQRPIIALFHERVSWVSV